MLLNICYFITFSLVSETMSKRLLIADASSLIFRGSAIKHKSDPQYKGGWSFLCRKIFNKIQQLNPTHVCIAGDGYQSSQKRKQISKDYKANRPECPPLIAYQLSNTYILCNILKITYTSYEGYEADDIINTFVTQALKHNFDSIDIIADDKDLFTLLIDSRVAIHKLSKSIINPIQILNPNEDVIPIKQFNVLPYQIPDFLALVGDSVDNIKGCPTIGIKRAQWLLNKYKNIDGIFAQLNDIRMTHKAIAKHLEENENVVREGLSMTKLHDLSDVLRLSVNDMMFDIDSLQMEEVESKLMEFGIETVCKDIKSAKTEISRDFDCAKKEML
eukprot:541990_1